MSARVSNRTRLLEANARLCARVKDELRKHVPNHSKEFMKYRDEVFLRSLDGAKPCKREELDASISSAEILLMGDFHPDYFCKKYLLQVLENLVKNGRNVILTIELVHIDEQPLLDQFLRGEIKERELKNSLKEGKGGLWADRWYMWSMILQFAKKAQIPVYGINSMPKNGNSLRKRDINAAKVIHDLKVQNPDALICTLIGDLHLGPTHLPMDINTLFDGFPPNTTIILQNLGPVYRNLVNKGKEQETGVVHIDENTFCVLYCTSIFRSISQLFDVIAIAEREELEGPNDDHIPYCATKAFELILSLLNDFLGTHIRKPKSDHLFAGFGQNGKIGFTDALGSQVSSDALKDLVLTKLSLNHYCVVPEKQPFVFVPTLHVRDVSEVLGSYVHYSLLKRKGENLFLTDSREFFYDEVLQRAIGYLFSKIINHYRTCLTPEDCIKIVEEGEGPFVTKREHTRASLFLEYFENQTDPKFFDLPPKYRFQLIRSIGYYLGERLFSALMREELSIDELRILISYDPRKQSTTSLYLELDERFSS